ncbi:MAG: DMT family transporter [Sedimentisphaerales bacterium]|nr:DMT family transporter [Sedimentisphaerales bacterium]
MKNQHKAYLLAGVAVVLWSTSASAFKICLSPEYLNISELSVLLGASLTSTAVMFIHLTIRGKFARLRNLSRRDYLYSGVMGFLNPFLYYLILFKAYSILPAQQAQPLNFVWPLVIVLLSVPLLKQKIKRRDIIAIMISFLGVVVISTEGRLLSFTVTDPLGVALALGSSIPWALFWIYNLKDRQDAVVRLFLNFAFASCYVFVTMLLRGRVKPPTLNQTLGIAYVGLVEMGITFLIWLQALKLSETTAHVTNLIYLVPFGALVVIHFVLGEDIHFSTIAGAILIIGGIAFQKFRKEHS